MHRTYTVPASSAPARGRQSDRPPMAQPGQISSANRRSSSAQSFDSNPYSRLPSPAQSIDTNPYNTRSNTPALEPSTVQQVAPAKPVVVASQVRAPKQTITPAATPGAESSATAVVNLERISLTEFRVEYIRLFSSRTPAWERKSRSRKNTIYLSSEHKVLGRNTSRFASFNFVPGWEWGQNAKENVSCRLTLYQAPGEPQPRVVAMKLIAVVH